MAQRKKKSRELELQNVSIIDVLLFDHRAIKDACQVLGNDRADKRRKLSVSRNFLRTVEKHSRAEKEVLYRALVDNEELHFNILEAQVEHGIIDEKVKFLSPVIKRMRALSDEVEAELKVLSDLLLHHLNEEEGHILPKMQEALDDETLFELGAKFIEARPLTAQDLRDYPIMDEERIAWKDPVQKLSSQFLNKVDKHVENVKH